MLQPEIDKNNHFNNEAMLNPGLRKEDMLKQPLRKEDMLKFETEINNHFNNEKEGTARRRR